LRNPFGAFDLAIDDLRASETIKRDKEALETLMMMQLASDSMAKIMNSVLDLEKVNCCDARSTDIVVCLEINPYDCRSIAGTSR
jgi:signal transduction histidine kinase